MFTSKKKTIRDLEQKLCDLEQKLINVSVDLEERNSTIANLEQELDEKNSTIANLEQELAERNSVIASLKQELALIDETIAGLEKRLYITRQQKALKDYRITMLKEHEANYHTLEAKYNTLYHECCEKDKEIETLKPRNELLELRLKEITKQTTSGSEECTEPPAIPIHALNLKIEAHKALRCIDDIIVYGVDINNMPLDALNLSYRARDVLARYGCKTFSDAKCLIRNNSIKEAWHCGEKTIDEIKNMVSRYGASKNELSISDADFEERYSKLKDITLDSLNLMTRPYRCLARAGCKTAFDVKRLIVNNALRDLYGCGSLSIDEIEEKMNQLDNQLIPTEPAQQ